MANTKYITPRYKNSQKYNRYVFNKNMSSVKKVNRTTNQRGGIRL